MTITVPQVVDLARKELSKLTGLELSTTLGTAKDEKGWRVSVEMVEKHSLPDGMDILATYEVLLNNEGQVLEFNRKRLRKRVDIELEEAE